VLVLAHPGHGEPAWVDRGARLLADLAIAQPRLACCLVQQPCLLRAYLDGAAETRAKAMVRESIVTVPGDEPEDACPARCIAAPPAPGALAYDPADDDRARSAAERLLFDRLEAMPETSGLFRLNETIDLAFGRNRKMEIDLAAPALKLAVEVDGYYHFQDPEAYRRDRRKDLELQKHEYLVVRVLAEDVLAEPGQAIETILGAIAHRRGRAGASTGDYA
jgi:very-short-patch-repair endonuclease